MLDPDAQLALDEVLDELPSDELRGFARSFACVNANRNAAKMEADKQEYCWRTLIYSALNDHKLTHDQVAKIIGLDVDVVSRLYYQECEFRLAQGLHSMINNF